MKLTIRNQTCHLLAEKAVFWEDQNTLILADIHIGKSTQFRKAGIPIPAGIMVDDLLTISHLINQWKVNKCIIVGDLIHSQAGLSNDVIKTFKEWLHNLNCTIHLIIGNHDTPLLKDMPVDWPLHTHKKALALEPFYFSHYPKHHPEWFVWAGHIHPKIEIKNATDRLVLRCFQIFVDRAILPAFGFFVGGTLVKKSADCKIYAIADSQVIEV